MTTPAADRADGTAPGEPPPPWLEELPPRKIVEELNRFIVGQDAAKKAVAIAIRNRWRRSQAPDGIRDEITPYNIIMIGPTGVGKTEVARRLARLAGAPFVKVEASKFTEVGYVGRDAESMVRELVDAAISMVRTEREDEVWPQAEQRADERLLDILLPAAAAEAGERRRRRRCSSWGRRAAPQPESVDADASRQRSREKLRQMLLDGKLDDRDVDIEISPQNYPMLDLLQQPPGHGGAGHQLRRDAAGHDAEEEEAADGAGARRPAHPDRRGAEEAGGHGRRGERGARPHREPRHPVHRRDRQDRRRALAERAGPT